MHCPKCQGLMIVTQYVANRYSDETDVDYAKCLNCGNCIDALILHHRVHRPIVKGNNLKNQARYAVREQWGPDHA